MDIKEIIEDAKDAGFVPVAKTNPIVIGTPNEISLLTLLTKFAELTLKRASEKIHKAAVGYIDPQSVTNLKSKVSTKEWLWANPDTNLIPLCASLSANEQDAKPFAWYREGNEINPNHIEHINERGETVYIEFRMSAPPENRGWVRLAIANKKVGV